jgi:uncharacterized protein (TIGR03437 family)
MSRFTPAASPIAVLVLFLSISSPIGWAQGPPALGLRQSFKGIDGHGPYPGNPNVAAGPSTVVIVADLAVTIMDKSGDVLDATDLFTFFGSVRIPQENADNPRIVWDRGSQRFFISAQSSVSNPGCQPGTCISHLFLAVSRSSAPASVGASDWFISATDATMENSTPTAFWSDFDGLGVNGEAVVISSNALSYVTGNPDHARLRIFDKARLLAGQLAFSDIAGMKDPVNGAYALNFEPAMHIDSSGTFFLVSPSQAYSCGVIVWGLTNPLSSPSLTPSTVAIGGVCGKPPHAAQPTGNTLIAVNDQTILSATPYRNGSLWTTREIAKDWGSGPVTAIRWYQINVSQWPAVSATQDGIFGLDGVWHFFPAIAVDAMGNVVFCFNRAGLNEFASVYYAAHLNGDPPGSVRTSVLLKAGTASLTAPDGLFGWGDWSGVVPDFDDGSFWIYAEYANSAPDNWATWVGQVVFAAPTQTIQFGSLNNVTLGVAPFDISATASSGLAVSFDTSTASTCTVSGTTVTVAASGTCSITALQQGNASVAAALPVTQSFAVAPTSQAFVKPGGVGTIYSTSTTIEPGSWVWIFGSNLSQTTRFWNPFTEIVNGALPTSLDGVSVLINGKSAYVYYISPGQINVQAPDDTTTGPVNVQITNSTGTSNINVVTLGTAGPSLFTYGDQYALGVVPTSGGAYDLMGPVGRYAFNTRPVHPGEVVELYGTGFGATNPPTPAGQIVSPPYGQTGTPIVVSIGGVSQTVTAFITEAGVWQMNVTIPNVGSGDQPLTATVAGMQTPDNLLISIQ